MSGLLEERHVKCLSSKMTASKGLLMTTLALKLARTVMKIGTMVNVTWRAVELE
jgi:hypothetical protein